MRDRFLGVDLGAETLKVIVLERRKAQLEIIARHAVPHHKQPAEAFTELLGHLDLSGVTGAAATGRAARLLTLSRVPTKAAMAEGVRHLYPQLSTSTVVSIGSRGFFVLELHEQGHEVFRENSRCSQGTGNFLQQLVERFDLNVAQASELCAPVSDPAPLSGRCPVILKTDMTHLANKGESKARILAGLYDAVCENVQVLLKPGHSPKDTLLVGGVSVAPRIRAHFKRFLASHGMHLHDARPDDTFLEAIGAARLAAERGFTLPETLVGTVTHTAFERLPALSESVSKIRRMPKLPLPERASDRDVLLGFDMGSTGSKAVALDLVSREPVWEGYLDTRGNPVGAAHELVRRFLSETEALRVRAVGATGSGREIVGSLLTTCFGPGRVYVLNEIAAHAEGAVFFDPEVDTIFEIGGQDAKYVRLDGGRICDAAMNEACSAGTGSFIAEQGQRFEGVKDVVQMGQIALGALGGVSLGQHCSVFMAEVIDEAVASGVERPNILAGIYDAIIQNYLNRVKGSRSVGQRIFCQGMPFASDALAAAVVRQTGADVVIPPNPGTIGALGIALLAGRQLNVAQEPVALARFLEAEVVAKETFVCKSTQGCGGAGNKCRIDRLRVSLAGEAKRFIWGGNCSLYDAGTVRKKLPDLAPDPFREREALVAKVVAPLLERRGRPVVALTDEFALKGLTPFFATFLHRLGFDLRLLSDAGHHTLKRGIEVANIPYCAPLQLYHGVMAELAETEPDFLFLPMLRELPRSADEVDSVTCPMVQASPDLVVPQLGLSRKTKLLSPRIDMGLGDLASERFGESCRKLAASLGVTRGFEAAYFEALGVQDDFVQACRGLGERALRFASEHGSTAVVVLGRAYTIYNTVLNSNVPNLLREQGAIAIPVDCYPIDEEVPVFRDVYWGYSQMNLRAAHQIRRTDGVYALFASNYSCGPDSFNLHFFSYIMQNKPFAIIETDGHSGDAGTKTRIEAFLHCVDEDRRLPEAVRAGTRRTHFKAIEAHKIGLFEAGTRDEVIELPPMGVGSPVIAAVLRADGLRAEVLPLPGREALRLGRKHTSGKECLPMTITLGSILERVNRPDAQDERFAFFMPTAKGPCRFGVYNLLHKIVFEQLGLKDRVQIIAPPDTNYFDGLPADLEIRCWVAFVAADLLLAALHDVRPVETEPGAAQAVFDRYYERLVRLLEQRPGGNLMKALVELPGEVFGVKPLLAEAAAAFSAIKGFDRDLPTVAFVGEIYCRLDPFANDFLIDKLEQRGIKVHMAPFHEWLEYTNYLQKARLASGQPREGDNPVSVHLTSAVMAGVVERFYDLFALPLAWGPRTTVKDAIAAAEPYLSEDLAGEAVLTIGGPVHEFLHGHVSGVVAAGPHECMPNKIAEAQYCHIGEEKGLVVLALPLNGDPVDGELIDRFAFEVKQHYARQQSDRAPVKGPARRLSAAPPAVRRPIDRWLDTLSGRAAMNSLKVLKPMTEPLKALSAKVVGRPKKNPLPKPAEKGRVGKVVNPEGLRWPPTDGSQPTPRS